MKETNSFTATLATLQPHGSITAAWFETEKGMQCFYGVWRMMKLLEDYIGQEVLITFDVVEWFWRPLTTTSTT